MSELKVALIGCGRIGYSFLHKSAGVGVYTHAEAYARAHGMKLVSVADTDINSARACAAEYDLLPNKIYASPYEMLEKEDVDIVSIASPDHTHANFAITALKKQGIKGVFIEKPLALNSKDAAEIVDLARANSIVVAVNYSRRYCSEHQLAEQEIRSGALGKIQAISGLYTKGLKHNGTHWLHLLDWFFGEMHPVYAFLSDASDFCGDLTPNVILKNNQFSAVLQGCDAQAFSLFEMDIIGSLGRIKILDGGHRFIRQSVLPSPRYEGYSELMTISDSSGHMTDLMLSAVQNFRDAVLNNTRPACSAEDALRALLVADLALSII